MEMTKKDDRDLNLEATELRLGLPGGIDDSENRRCNKRAFSFDANDQEFGSMNNSNRSAAPASKAQVVGWPPIRSYRKYCLQLKKTVETESAGNFIKVSMDGAPYLRKIDLKVYKGYTELLKAMEDMFKFSVGEGYNGSGFVPTYEDKDGDWMLVGDVPWEMFITSCKRLRIMKGSEARGTYRTSTRIISGGGLEECE